MVISGDYANSSLALKQGIVIDLTRKCFSKFSKYFFLFKFKEACKPLPAANYLLLFRTIYTKCQTHTAEEFENQSITQLSMVYDRNKKLIVHESANMEEVKQVAIKLAGELKLRIMDSATNRRKPKWLA
jgi:hypothetical protein